jgi:hypothetical protein
LKETKMMTRREENPIRPTTEAALWRKKRKIQAAGLPDLLPALAALAVFRLLFQEDLSGSGSMVGL